MTIAIDGPAGAGKSSVARSAAAILRCAYIDTGALYRSVALAALRAGVATSDPAAVEAFLPRIDLRVAYVGGAQHVYLGKEDVSEAIRAPEVSLATSETSKHACVRSFLLQLQRDLANAQDSILDGRDIGTVVLPNADIKIFLTAAAEERAHRRWLEQKGKGVDEAYEDVLAAVIARDEQDMNREHAPLKPAQDSILLDSTGMTLEQSVQALLRIIEAKRS